jgi:methanogenic corrinoid protein MtbC1
MELEIIRQEFKKAIVDYDKNKAFSLFDQYSRNEKVSGFVDNIMVCVLEDIGDQWEKGLLSLSQVYLSSKICEQLVNTSFPMKVNTPLKSPKMAIVTLEDHHVLGKRIVSSVLRSSGYALDDYGHGVSAEDVIKKTVDDQVQILLISVLMYPSALKVKKVKEGLLLKNMDTKILVGGAPFLFDTELWKKVGADAMGRHAADDIKIIENWIQGREN